MGLDMRLVGRKFLWNRTHCKDNDIYRDIQTKVSELFPDMDYLATHVEFELAYWRRARDIHEWFVEKVQEGVDDCNLHHVPIAQFTELLKSGMLEDLEVAMVEGAKKFAENHGTVYYKSSW